eukprot:m.124218 g.124218  ORF g.124218 m.124218 type:complete len:381 (+) comp15698_c0_seq2:1632-2774(+)
MCMQWPTPTLVSQFLAFVNLSERCAAYNGVSNYATVAKIVELLELTAFKRDWNADCKLLKYSEALIRRNSQLTRTLGDLLLALVQTQQHPDIQDMALLEYLLLTRVSGSYLSRILTGTSQTDVTDMIYTTSASTRVAETRVIDCRKFLRLAVLNNGRNLFQVENPPSCKLGMKLGLSLCYEVSATLLEVMDAPAELLALSMHVTNTHSSDDEIPNLEIPNMTRAVAPQSPLDAAAHSAGKSSRRECTLTWWPAQVTPILLQVKLQYSDAKHQLYESTVCLEPIPVLRQLVSVPWPADGGLESALQNPLPFQICLPISSGLQQALQDLRLPGSSDGIILAQVPPGKWVSFRNDVATKCVEIQSDSWEAIYQLRLELERERS